MAAPARLGFGTQLLKAVFPGARLEYAVEGLRCEIEFPLGDDGHRVSPPRPQAKCQDDNAAMGESGCGLPSAAGAANDRIAEGFGGAVVVLKHRG